MKRNLQLLGNKTFDLLIVGGGIYGASLAWEASIQGLQVALIDKGDFGGATSANSLKIIHGGLRYLQQANLPRVRISACERTTIMRIAPHLVHPLSCCMPTQGHFMKGREAMIAAFLANDIISFDRNKNTDPQKYIPCGKTVSRHKFLDLVHNLESDKINGGAIWTDAIAKNTERLTLAFVQSACQKGTIAANYVKAIEFIKNKNQVLGARVKDMIKGEEFDIQAKITINATGPWMSHTNIGLRDQYPHLRLAKAFNILVPEINKQFAIGLRSKEKNRFLFIVPWQGHSIIGTEYIPYNDDPDNLSISEKEIQGFLNVINETYPALKLSLNNVLRVYQGLMPIDGINSRTSEVILSGNFQIIDHQKKDNIKGLVSILGVKYTTARYEAKKTIKYVLPKLGMCYNSKINSAKIPLFGGTIPRFNDFLTKQIQVKNDIIGHETCKKIVYNYGSEIDALIKEADTQEYPGITLPKSSILEIEVLYAIHHEMAQKLSDVVFRRTDLGNIGKSHQSTLERIAQIMAIELEWDQQRISQELDDINKSFRNIGN